MFDEKELEKSLRAILPVALQEHAMLFAKLISTLVNPSPLVGDSDVTNAIEVVTPQVAQSLAGKQIAIADAVVSFGEGTQTGDIHIRDVASGNIINFTLNMHNSEHRAHSAQITDTFGEKERIAQKAHEDTTLKETVDRIALRDIIVKHFNRDEIVDLCFDIGVNYESVKGDGVERKVVELITYLERRGRYQDLVSQVVKLRPHAIRDKR